MVSQLQESQRQLNDALAMCKSAIEANDVSYVSDYCLKLEPDFREAKTVFEVKEVVPLKDQAQNGQGAKHLTLFQEPKVDPFADSNTGFGEEFKSNGFSSDPFGSTGFDGGFNARSGFDDSFGNSFSNQSDAFGVVSTSSGDPFGDKRGVVPAVTPDVS